MGKKNRRGRVKKPIVLKTREDRCGEVLDIFSKFREVGLEKKINGVDEFFSICKDYVNDGVARQGKVKIPGEKRVIEYLLPVRKNTLCSINLKYDENV